MQAALDLASELRLDNLATVEFLIDAEDGPTQKNAGARDSRSSKPTPAFRSSTR